MLNSASIPQTFSAMCRIAHSAWRHSYKAWISRVRAINEQVIRRTSPARGQSTLKNGVERRVWWQLASLAARNRLLCLPNIALTLIYDISSYMNAYFHPNYLFRDKIWGMHWYVNSHRNCWNNMQLPLYALIRFYFWSTGPATQYAREL